MKIILEDDDIKIYLNKEYIKEIDISNLDRLEDYLSKVLVRLKKGYQLEILGYYELKILYDQFYGIALVLKKHDFEDELFESQIDLDLNINKNNFFLYQIDDLESIENEIKKNFIIYLYNQKLYLKLTSEIHSLQMVKLLEFCNIVSGDKVKKIVSKGKIICV